MGKKYIIELEDSESVYKTIIANGYPMLQVIVPAPYTEPDLEQVRKKAYQSGYETAKHEREDCTKPLDNGKAYQQGLTDAWEAARKICTNWVLPDSVLSKIFGIDKTIDDIMKENTASECIEKIRQYEQEQEEQIQVGDEVKCIRADWTAIVTKIKEGHMTLMDNDGAVANGYDVNDFVKTGRHFPEIAEVLRKMKENSDG